jgi:NAD(P)-dependent dehydrogenase (short-subunit alcohol dehydrogenase family)
LVRILNDQGGAARILDLEDENDAARALQWLDTPGPVLSGVAHLAALDPTDCLSDYSAWHHACRLQVKAFFQLLKQARPFFGAAEAQSPRLISASLLGGRFGRSTASASIPVAGAGAAGILKCLQHEWPDVSTRCLDFDSGLEPTRIAALLAKELAHDTGETEVGYTAGQRLVFEPAAVPVEQRKAGLYRLPDQGVIVATGGARGITSLVVKALGASGARVILIGRRELSPTVEEGPFDAEAAAELRAELIARDRTAGVTRTPKAIEGEVVRTLQDREARSTIAALEQAGARVEYRTCNVASPEAFGELLDELQSKHRIDLLIHGAGVIEDSLLTEKTTESFDRVFDTKADSAFTIVSRLQPGRVGNLVFFASTAARFGNTGQSDYAAANEVLNRLAWAAQAASASTRFCAINWGPWVGAGMVDAGLERHFKEQGVPVISADAGVEFLCKELAQSPPQCEVIFGGGPWAETNHGHANNLAEKDDLQLPLTADARG